ncbi:hypothetical protein S245_044392, partial [Arachis hypogaea]
VLSWSSLTSVQPPPAPFFPSIAQPPCERCGSLRGAAMPLLALALFHRSHCPVRSSFKGAPCLGVFLLRALLKNSSSFQKRIMSCFDCCEEDNYAKSVENGRQYVLKIST